MTADSNQHNTQQQSTTGPRMWPALLIVIVHLATTWAAFVFSSTDVQTLIGSAGAPVVATIGLIIWWMMARMIRMRERLAGLVLLIVVHVLIVLIHKSKGPLLLMLTLPVTTTGVVGLLLLTCRMTWPVRRWSLVIMLLGCAVAFASLRVDGVSANLFPLVSWRWTTTSEELAMLPTARPPAEPAVLPAQAAPDDWPAFRGPAHDGRVPATTFSTDWDKAPPKELWRRPIGIGWSSFAAVGDYLFTQEQRGENELVTCYRAETGEEVWINSRQERYESDMGAGPRATPTFHKGNLYTLNPTGVLLCLDASTGQTIWQRNMTEDTEVSVPMWGYASSPLVTDKLVIVFSGAPDEKSVLAYDRVSGVLIWTAGKGSHSYSTGHLAHIEDIQQVLISSNFGIQSFVPETGEVLWEHAWDIGKYPRIVQPLITDDNTILLSTNYGHGTRLLRVLKKADTWQVVEGWTTKKFRPYFNDSVYHEGYCYGFDGNRLFCINAKTGERVWRGKRHGGQLLLITDMAMLLILNEAGQVVLVEASPEAYTEIARFKALKGKTWNHPVVAHGKLFVRNAEEAACYALGR